MAFKKEHKTEQKFVIQEASEGQIICQMTGAKKPVVLDNYKSFVQMAGFDGEIARMSQEGKVEITISVTAKLKSE
jgi:hypothetical protein